MAALPADVAASEQISDAERRKRPRFLALALVLLATLALTSSWLVFPYFFEGKKILQNAGAEVAAERSAQHRTLSSVLLRVADGPGEAVVEVLFATSEYFERASSPRVAAKYATDDNYIFIVSETVHVGELPVGLPNAELVVDGARYRAADAEGPDFADHHRSIFISFAKRTETGAPVIPDDARRVELSLSNGWDEDNTPRTALWDLPINYPEGDGSVTSPMLVMALAAGLLSATLTPCLLQLIVVYMATLTGLSAEQLRGGEVPAAVRKRMLAIAVAFVVGVTFFYTSAGALIGYAGKSAQLVFDTYSRELALGSGMLVILMGLWMGVQTRAPLICKIPMPGTMARVDRGGYLRSGLMAVGFSLGCMVCFSGSIMALLFIYVGVLGSAAVGAFILFVFSMGVAIPFLAAAFFLSRTFSVMQWVSRYTPQIGLVSATVIIGFGVILVLDQFHTVSDLIYPWLGLG